MTESCVFCDLLKNPQSDSSFITEFDHSVAFLNFEQEAYPGASLLILKDHYDHLHDVPLHIQSSVATEMMILTRAILDVFGGFRANHMSLGNCVPHVHWHIIPRYPNDLNAGGMPDYMKDEVRLSDDAFRERALMLREVITSSKS